MNGFDKNTELLEGLEVGLSGRWLRVKQPAGVDSLPAIRHELRLDGGFSLQRMRTHDPMQTPSRLVLAAIEHRLNKHSIDGPDKDACAK